VSIQCPSDRERGRIGVLPRSIKFVIRKKERHHRADVENIVLGDGCSLSLCHFFFNKQFKHLNKSQTVAVHRRAAYRKRSFSNLRQTECRRGFVSLVTEVVFLFVVLKNNCFRLSVGALALASPSWNPRNCLLWTWSTDWLILWWDAPLMADIADQSYEWISSCHWERGRSNWKSSKTCGSLNRTTTSILF